MSSSKDGNTESEPDYVSDPIYTPLSSTLAPNIPENPTRKEYWSHAEKSRWTEYMYFGQDFKIASPPPKDIHKLLGPNAKLEDGKKPAMPQPSKEGIRRQRGDSLLKALEKGVQKRAGAEASQN